MRKPMLTIMLTTSWIIPVHDRVWSMDLGNPVDNAPCRLYRLEIGLYCLVLANLSARNLLASFGKRNLGST